MGKIVICTDNEKMKRFQMLFGEHFSVSSEFSTELLHITAYKKLRINNENFYRIDDNNFIFGVGTYLYKSDGSTEALRKILEDYSDEFNKEDIAGSFCIAIMKNNKLEVFIDSGNTYDIYYNITNDEIVLSNTIYHTALVLGEKQFNYENILAECISFAYVSNETFCKNIYRLSGKETLVLVNGAWSLLTSSEVYNCSTPVDIWERLENKTSGIRNLIRKPGVFMTGGQDSRLYLAFLMKHGYEPTLYYGKGNSFNTCTKENDALVVEQISEKLSLTMKYMDWSEVQDEQMDDRLLKYGELFAIYRGNKNIFDQFEKEIECDAVFFGYFGEIYRNVETISDYKKEYYTLDEYIDEMYLSSSLKVLCSNYQDFRNKFRDSLKKVCEMKNIDSNRLCKKDFVKLNAIYRERADTRMNNLVNQFMYTAPFFGDGEIVRQAENIEYDKKNNSVLLMEGIYYYKPELVKVPFFSHIKEKVFNPETFELIDKKVVSKYKESVKKIIKNPIVLKLLRNIYYSMLGDNKGKEELNEDYKEKKFLLSKMKFITWMQEDNYDELYSVDSRSLKNILLYDKMIQSITKCGL